MIYDFQIHAIKDNIATGYFIIKNIMPNKDDFWNNTGEIKFGEIYQETGYYDMDSYNIAMDLYFQRNNKKSILLPKNIDFLPGHCIRVKFINPTDNTGTFFRFLSISGKIVPPKEILKNK